MLLSVRRCFFINREKLIIERIQLRFSLKFDSKSAGRMTYVWEEMASVVARTLVENGQTRILQRIHEGLTSNWVLDIADAKSSIDHHLIHLVWRKFPRNRHTAEERRQTDVSTQIEKDSSAELGCLGSSAGLTRPSKKISNQACYSSSDLGNLFASESAPTSDAGWTSDCTLSSTVSVAQEGTSFKFPAKGRTSKPKLLKSKPPTKLVNRYKCLEEIKPEMGKTLGVTVRKSPAIDKFRKRKDVPRLTSEIPTTSFQEDVTSNLRRRGTVKWYDPTRMSYGFITMHNKDVFFNIKNVRGGVDHVLQPGDEVSFLIDEYDKGVIDVQFLPTPSDFQSTSDVPMCEVESRQGDESWETVGFNSENEELVEDEEDTKLRNIENKLQLVEGRLQNFLKIVYSISAPRR